MKRFIYLIIICTLLVGCKGNQQKTTLAESDGKPMVTVTIPPYQYFVDKIAQDKVGVNVMVPAGGNPETYEPTAQQMVELSKSALYLKVGNIGFEQTWMQKLHDNAPHMKVVDTSVGISPAKTPGGNIDPHVWMSCSNARIISANILKALCNLDRRDSTIRMSFQKNPEMVRKFVIYHPILTYFARDYKLEQLAIEEEGREPSVAQLKSLIERAKKEKIKYCLIQTEFANRNTSVFIKETHTHAMEINPLQGEWNMAMQEASLAIQGKQLIVADK